MRPTPAELIDGVRRILRDVVEPDVGSDHTRKQLREIRAVLVQVDWNDAGFALAERNRRLYDALTRVRRWVDADAVRQSGFAAAGAGLRDIEAPARETFDAHVAWERRLGAAAVAVVDPLADWLSRFPGDAEAAALRQQVLDSVG